MQGAPDNLMVKVVHDKYKKTKKVNKKTGEEYQAIIPAGSPCGVVVALKTPKEKIKVGWSKCNLKLDKFNKVEGVKLALKNLHEVQMEAVDTQDGFVYTIVDGEDIPHELGKQVIRMAHRAGKYYNKVRNAKTKS